MAKTAAKVAAAATLAATRATAGLEGAPAAEPFPAAGGAAAEGGPTPMTTSKPAGSTTASAGALHKNKDGLDVDEAASWTGAEKLGKELGGKEETGGPAATPPSTPMGGSGGEVEGETAAAPFASEAFYKGGPGAGIKGKLSGEGDVLTNETYHPGVAAKTRSPMEKEMTGALSPSTPAETIPASMERPTFGTTATTTPDWHVWHFGLWHRHWDHQHDGGTDDCFLLLLCAPFLFLAPFVPGQGCRGHQPWLGTSRTDDRVPGTEGCGDFQTGGPFPCCGQRLCQCGCGEA